MTGNETAHKVVSARVAIDDVLDYLSELRKLDVLTEQEAKAETELLEAYKHIIKARQALTERNPS